MLSGGGIPALSKATFLAGNSEEGFARIQQIASRSSQGEELTEEDIREVGKKFESLLLHQLMSTMRKTVPENDLFENSSATKIYRDMFDEQVAEQVALSGQTGLAEEIVQEILRQQQEKKVKLPTGDSPLRSLAEKANPMRPLDQSVPLTPVPRASGEPKPIDRGEAELRPIPR